MISSTHHQLLEWAFLSRLNDTEPQAGPWGTTLIKQTAPFIRDTMDHLTELSSSTLDIDLWISTFGTGRFNQLKTQPPIAFRPYIFILVEGISRGGLSNALLKSSRPSYSIPLIHQVSDPIYERSDEGATLSQLCCLCVLLINIKL